MLTCYEIWGLFVWNQCHFPGCCQPVPASRDILCPWPSPLALQLSAFPPPALAAPPQLLFWVSLLPPVLPWDGRFCQRLSPHPRLSALLGVLAHSQGCSHHSPAIPKSTSLTSWAYEVSSCGLCMAKPRTCPSPVLLDHHQFCSRSDLVSDQGFPVLPSKYSSDSSWLPAGSLLPSRLCSFHPYTIVGWDLSVWCLSVTLAEACCWVRPLPIWSHAQVSPLTATLLLSPLCPSCSVF